jgi:protein-L-isoaspartate(D-aspartate) O-methyltransferase
VDQLAEGGRLVAPVGPPEGQNLVVGTKKGGKLQTHAGLGCIFVKLIGSQAYQP